MARPRVDLAKRADPQAETRRRQRDLQALQLHLAGMTFDQIAAEVGFANRGNAWRAVHRLLAREQAEGVAEARAVGGARMERLLAAVWAKALRGDMKAVAEARRLEEARWRLFGLNAPVKVDARVRSQLDADIEELVAQLNARVDGDDEQPGAGTDIGAEKDPETTS